MSRHIHDPETHASSPFQISASGTSNAKSVVLPPFRNILLVASGGAAGTTCRYLFVLFFPAVYGSFPLTIFFENIIGAFLLGFVMTLVLEHPRWRWEVRPFLTTGVLGSFTTFSAMSLDLVLLVNAGHGGTALLYAVLSIGVGLAAVLSGVRLARFFSGGSA